jgi:hypothetical protein
MLASYRLVAARLHDVLRPCLSIAAALAVAAPAAADVLDFGAALQGLPAGTPVGTVQLDNGATMTVWCRNGGGGPDLCIVFDSADPTGGDFDLGTPNEDFGGPGIGAGGEEGEPGANAEALGKVLIIAEDDTDEDGDGLVDEPDDEAGGGVVWLQFSHAGRLSMTLVDVDEDEDDPRFVLYHGSDLVGSAAGENLGQNGAQDIDLGDYGEVDLVEVHLDGSTSLAAIQLGVPIVGVEPHTWSNVKVLYR